MTPEGPPHIEAFTLITGDEFLEMAVQHDALSVRIKRTGFSHVISALMMISDEKVDGYSRVWMWLHSDKVVLPFDVDLLVTDIKGLISIEGEDNPYENITFVLKLKNEIE